MQTHHPADERGLQRLSEAFLKPLALDTETTSLNWYELECEGISLANETDVIWIAGKYLTSGMTSLLDKLLTKCPELVMHNAPFDLAVLHKLGIFYTGNVFCTQTAAHLLDENGPKSLKDLASKHLRVSTKKYSQVQYLRRDSEEFVKYACNDAVWTYQLYKLYKPLLTEEGLDKLFYKIEMPFQFVLKDMKVAGIEANGDLAERFERELEEKEFELLQQLHDAAGLSYTINCDLLGNKMVDSKWNFNSPKQLVDIIQGKLGLEIPYTTDTGEPSVGRDTKKALKHHKFIQILDLYSRCDKLLTGFIRPFKTYVDGDNRIRGDFNNTVAVTGRLSSSGPNLQNLAKDSDDLNVKVRECFEAKDGYLLIAADFNGQELRVLAELTKDPLLLKAFERGQDLHLSTANAIFNLGISDDDLCETSPNYHEIKEKHAKKRHIAKNGVLFPLIYGSTAKGISISLGCSEAEAQGYIDAFFRAYPAVRRSIENCHKFLIKNGYVFNLTGRRRRFRKEFGKYPAKAFRQAYNFLIQSTSADMTKASMVIMWRELAKRPAWDAKIVITVHDEVVVECREQFATECAELLKSVMKSAYPLSHVALEVEAGIGKTYSEAK